MSHLNITQFDLFDNNYKSIERWEYQRLSSLFMK